MSENYISILMWGAGTFDSVKKIKITESFRAFYRLCVLFFHISHSLFICPLRFFSFHLQSGRKSFCLPNLIKEKHTNTHSQKYTLTGCVSFCSVCCPQIMIDSRKRFSNTIRCCRGMNVPLYAALHFNMCVCVCV